MITYLAANKVAGYSGFVLYNNGGVGPMSQISFWMIPGTWEYDWDNC